MVMEYIKIYYLHTSNNVPFYIGKTSTKLEVRLSSHKIRLKEQNLKIKLLDEVLKDEWKFWESYWIEQLRQWGFILKNKNKGGGGLEKHSDLTKIKISKSKIGKPNPFKGIPKPKEFGDVIKNHPTRGKKISKSNMGKTHSNKGKPFTEEHKQKIKSTRDFLKTRKNTWQNTPIFQYDLQGNFIKEWDSQKEASAFLKIKGDGVGACCRKKQKSAYGFIWKFKTN
jgi:hypothetical protein